MAPAAIRWIKPREAWLLELAAPCNDLRHANAASLPSTGSRVQARFDSVLPLGPMVGQVGRVPCRIETIRPLDTAALRQAGDALREARIEARD